MLGARSLPHAADREHTIDDDRSFSSQRTTTNAQPLLLYEGQILQMLIDMKKQGEASPVRSRSGVDDSRLREHLSQTGGAEATQRLTPSSNCGPPRHPGANAIGGRTWKAENAVRWAYHESKEAQMTSLLRENGYENKGDSPNSGWGFSTTKLRGRSRSFPISEPSTN